MDAPCIVVACICLEKLAAAEVAALGVPSYTQVVGIGVGLE